MLKKQKRDENERRRLSESLNSSSELPHTISASVKPKQIHAGHKVKSSAASVASEQPSFVTEMFGNDDSKSVLSDATTVPLIVPPDRSLASFVDSPTRTVSHHSFEPSGQTRDTLS